MSDPSLCAHCQIGYHAPFDRFEQLAVIANGPEFLKRCNVCGSLWQETLRDANRHTSTEAAKVFPGNIAQDFWRGG